MHNLASARSAGNALVQVAESSHSDERQASSTGRALHVCRKQVIPHWEIWHRFTPSPRVSGGTQGSISSRSSQYGGSGYGGSRGARHRFDSGSTRAGPDNRLLARARASLPLHTTAAAAATGRLWRTPNLRMRYADRKSTRLNSSHLGISY